MSLWSWFSVTLAGALTFALGCGSDAPSKPEDGAAGDAGAGGSGGTSTGCVLTDSGPVSATADGQVFEYLHIVAGGGQPAIEVNGFSGVVIRNVWIEHASVPGISFTNAANLSIENAVVEHVGAPESGENESEALNNIEGHASQAPSIHQVKLARGSSGIYLVDSPDSFLSFIEGYDFRGPFPRGQLVQWDKSDRGRLQEFSVVNPSSSWPEDNVNVYQSPDVEIRGGFIDGNNSPSGVGVIFDGGTSTGLVEDVDAVHMGNGCFSDYAGGEDVTFRNTGCRDNICDDQGRGEPSSGGLMWAGHPAYTTLRIEASRYFAPCDPNNVVWPVESFAVIETDETDFVPRPALEQHFCWE